MTSNNSGMNNVAPPIPPRRVSTRLKSTADRQSWPKSPRTAISKPPGAERIQTALPESPELATHLSRAVSDSGYQNVVWASASGTRNRKSWSTSSARDAPPPVPAKRASLRVKSVAMSTARRRRSWGNTTVENAPPPVPAKRASQRVKPAAVSTARNRSAGSNITVEDAPSPASGKRTSARIENMNKLLSRVRSASADARSRSLSEGSVPPPPIPKKKSQRQEKCNVIEPPGYLQTTQQPGTTASSPRDNSVELGVHDTNKDKLQEDSFSQSADTVAQSRYSSFRGFGDDSTPFPPFSDVQKSSSRHCNLSGYLEKGGGRAQQPRYFFVLTGHDLVYYKDYAAKAEEPDHPLGAYDLRGSSVEEIVTETKRVDGTTLKKWRFFLSWPLPDMGDPAVFEWGVEEQSTDIILTAVNQTEFKRWTQALRSAIASAGKVSEDDEYTDSDSESASDAEGYFVQTKANHSSSSGSDGAQSDGAQSFSSDFRGAKGDEDGPPEHTAQPPRGEARPVGNQRSWTQRRRSPRVPRSQIIAKKNKRTKKRRGWFKIFRKRGKSRRKTSRGYSPVPEPNNINPDHYDNELLAVMTRIERKMNKRERKYKRSALLKARASKGSPRLSPKKSTPRSPKAMLRQSPKASNLMPPHAQMPAKMSPQMIRVASMDSQSQTSPQHTVWSMDMFTPYGVDTPSTDSPQHSVQHCLNAMRQEVAASRQEMVAQREQFQRQLDVQSEQIRQLQETLQALVTKLGP